MFSHVTLGITDFDRAMQFYRPVMARLGLSLRFSDISVPWAAWQPEGGGRPLFIIMHPQDGQTASPGNGAMPAFIAPDRQCVRDAYRIGLQSGGRDEGVPGLRPQYHPNYYGAYLRDPDGNKLCFVCHSEEA